MTVGPPYWVEVLTKGGREIIWTTLPDKQVGYFCLPGLIPVGRYIPITPVLHLHKTSEGQTARATSILGPKTASFYSSARLASVFWSSTRLGILNFLADLQVLGSEYSTFRPTFEYSARNARLFGRTSECNHSDTVCPNHLKFAVQVVPTMVPCRLIRDGPRG